MEKIKVVLITGTLLGLIALAGCSPGWSAFGYEVDSDSTYVYLEVLDSDSVSHFYADMVEMNKSIWCHTHNRYEIVRKK